MAFYCPECSDPSPHDHGTVWTPNGTSAPAIIYRVEDPRAEVRDPDSGEVIFPAVKGPLKLIQGGLPTPPQTLDGETP